MGNATSWLAQSLCPEEQVLWVAAKSGDVASLRAGLARLTPQTRFYAEWRDPMYGYSPLANACSMGHLQCVQALVSAGVDCNARDAQGNTPLHIAVVYGKSEVVRLLLDTLAVDYFAKTTAKAQTALDIARQAYKASEGNGHKFVQCIEHIEKKLCIYSGWLYARSDNFLSIASGLSALDSWKRRSAMVLRSADRDVVEIDLFSMKPGERRSPCPSSELIYRARDGIQENDDITWLSRKEFRFSLMVFQKSGTSRASAPQSMDFAATSQGELVAWKTFLTNLRVNGPPTVITTAFGANRSTHTSSNAAPAQHASPSQAALLQEQRDLERATQLSVEEARRCSRTVSNPSAPPPSGTMLEALGYAQSTVAPDGVEIVQQLHEDSFAGHASSAAPPGAPSSVSHAKTIEDSESMAAGECVICFDGPQAAVCVPCGHNAICMNCAQELLDTTRLCPVCRQTVREVIRLFRV